jgi:hypothetical protein
MSYKVMQPNGQYRTIPYDSAEANYNPDVEWFDDADEEEDEE